jgi:NAD(P)-dependent dehydrogenase (short-subunit alcohol dehydrogenase family)
MAAAAAELGPIAILVNGAAAPAGLVRNDIEAADPEALLADLNTKVVGYFRCVKAVVPHMRAHRYGRIVNIGGLTGRSSHALSGMRNLAVVHLTKVLSDQLGPDGITINTLHPGVVETEHIHELYAKNAAAEGITAAQVEQNFIDRTPIRRVLTADEIADAVCFFAGPGSGGITGESLGIDGGLTRGIFL